jgi:hypothetical protein
MNQITLKKLKTGFIIEFENEAHATASWDKTSCKIRELLGLKKEKKQIKEDRENKNKESNNEPANKKKIKEYDWDNSGIEPKIIGKSKFWKNKEFVKIEREGYSPGLRLNLKWSDVMLIKQHPEEYDSLSSGIPASKLPILSGFIKEVKEIL